MKAKNIKKLDSNYIKIENRKLVFTHIFNHPGISRPEIVAHTKLSSASVGRITDDLLKKGLIKEYDSDARNVGRRPMLLRVCGESVPAVAIELERSRQVCAVIDLTGKIHYRTERNICISEYNIQDVCRVIRDMFDEVIAQPDLSRKIFSGIGIALPGLVDLDSGMIRLSSHFHWRNVPFGAIIQEYFSGMTIVIDNEMNAHALAESIYGELQYEQNAVIIGIGSGVGAGIISNGHIYRGDNNTVGEVGHIIMDPNGKMCECGRYGCLETFVTDWALVEDARRHMPDACINDIITAADLGEQWAISIIERFVKYTKTAISYFECLLNPGVVVLSGYMLEEYPGLVKRILEYDTSYMSDAFKTSFRLTMSGLGRDGALTGAAIQLLHKVYDEYI